MNKISDLICILFVARIDRNLLYVMYTMVKPTEQLLEQPNYIKRETMLHLAHTSNMRQITVNIHYSLTIHNDVFCINTRLQINRNRMISDS